MESYGKVLLVEDDLSLAQWIKEYLQEHGYQVTHTERGDNAVYQFNKVMPDLVLLDVMLPGMDGIQVCRELRTLTNIPIVMLTARGDELDEVIGLEVGANDYVVKPVRPRALLARIKTLIRNQKDTLEKNTDSLVLSFGQLSLDSEAKRVIYMENEINLSSGEFDFLWFLARNAGKAVSRDQVFVALKGREYDGQDRRFDLMISGIRKKFDDNPQHPQKIKTIWGKGYLFVADAWD
ncbi:response regulator transcription factor [Aliikangiella coralliicola]|uniref:Response regulator transcription factor n=1 Tax=Aliikangiella coralliicola TaxID=2592383 RepID=A0A545UEK6_9GAMM|nr:response regulator transcription factor [Aliikangiella coralliicola]TQV87911.1 response regulator transcription factor [Aliikangiella coralliicola]